MKPPVETEIPQDAPDLTDPIGANGSQLMGIAPWPAAPEPAPEPAPDAPAPAQSPAELRAQAEKLLAEADALEK